MEYIAVIEQGCSKLGDGKAEEFRVGSESCHQEDAHTQTKHYQGGEISLDRAKERSFQNGSDS